MKGVTVVVCCYNSVKRLEATLQHLAQQKTNDLLWEVIVIDNASVDETTAAATAIWDGYAKKDIGFKVIQERTPGLSYARQTGIAAASYDYIIFCDDDNWLDNAYVQLVADILSADRSIGVLGGQCHAVSETDLPTWFHSMEGFYATGKQAGQTGDVGNRNFVFGAGMAFRKSDYLRLIEAGFRHLLTDRTGTSLVSGGDVEICYIYRLAGYKIWYDERLQFIHYMPAGRLQQDYLDRLKAGAAEGVRQLQVYDPYLKGKRSPTGIKGINFLYYFARMVLAALMPGKDHHYFTTYAEAYNPFGFSFNRKSTILKKALQKSGRASV